MAALAQPEDTSLLVLENFHRFLHSSEIVQALIQQTQVGKQRRTFIVILAPIVQLRELAEVDEQAQQFS